MTLFGIVILGKAEQFSKAFCPIDKRLSFNAIFFRLLQPEKANFPIFVTFSGMITLVRLLLYPNVPKSPQLYVLGQDESSIVVRDVGSDTLPKLQL